MSFSLPSFLFIISPIILHAFTLNNKINHKFKIKTQSPTSLNADVLEKEQQWKPKIASLSDRKQLRNQDYNSEKISSKSFHHIEFYCGDAKSTAHQLAISLGMNIVGTTSQATGNDQCVSYALESGTVRFLITAPYSMQLDRIETNSNSEFDAMDPLPSFQIAQAHEFFSRHGLAARAIGIEVEDVQTAYENSIQNGAKNVLEPTFVPACPGITKTIENSNNEKIGCDMAEVKLYGDVVLRYIKHYSPTLGKSQPFLPHLSPLKPTKPRNYGIQRIDHAVGNVPNLFKTHEYIATFTGFHEFAEFTSEDVGTVESGLNSVVLASDSEQVLLPLNEPTEGKRKSQIQTFLEQNEGPGLQHLALKTNDVFETIREMRRVSEEYGGLEFMRRPSNEYYRELPSVLGDLLTQDQYEQCEELGILADADEEGVLLQIFTKPIGDRPTFFIEIIQRIGCIITETEQKPGCGGFGRGNFKELFKAIEEHEKTLKV